MCAVYTPPSPEQRKKFESVLEDEQREGGDQREIVLRFLRRYEQHFPEKLVARASDGMVFLARLIAPHSQGPDLWWALDDTFYSQIQKLGRHSVRIYASNTLSASTFEVQVVNKKELIGVEDMQIVIDFLNHPGYS